MLVTQCWKMQWPDTSGMSGPRTLVAKATGSQSAVIRLNIANGAEPRQMDLSQNFGTKICSKVGGLDASIYVSYSKDF